MFEEEQRIYQDFLKEARSGHSIESWQAWLRDLSSRSDHVLVQRRASGGLAEAEILDRYGEAIGCFELILAIGMGLGEAIIEEVLEQQPDPERGGEIEVDQHVWRLLAVSRLWYRTVGVGEEVLALLKQGFSAAALGRWRTMHELDVISLVLGQSTDPRTSHELLRYQERDQARLLREWKVLKSQFPKGLILRGDYGWADSFVAASDPSGYGGSMRRDSGPSFGDLQRAVGVTARERSLFKAASGVLHGSWLVELFGGRTSYLSDETKDEDLRLGITATLSGAARTIWSATGTVTEMAEFAGAAVRRHDFPLGETLISLLHELLGIEEVADQSLI